MREMSAPPAGTGTGPPERGSRVYGRRNFWKNDSFWYQDSCVKWTRSGPGPWINANYAVRSRSLDQC